MLQAVGFLDACVCVSAFGRDKRVGALVCSGIALAYVKCLHFTVECDAGLSRILLVEFCCKM